MCVEAVVGRDEGDDDRLQRVSGWEVATSWASPLKGVEPELSIWFNQLAWKGRKWKTMRPGWWVSHSST
jgi:hypothetical protein